MRIHRETKQTSNALLIRDGFARHTDLALILNHLAAQDSDCRKTLLQQYHYEISELSASRQQTANYVIRSDGIMNHLQGKQHAAMKHEGTEEWTM